MAESPVERRERTERESGAGPGVTGVEVLPKDPKDMPPRPKDDPNLTKLEVTEDKLTTPAQHEELRGKLATLDALPGSVKLGDKQTLEDVAKAAIEERSKQTREKSDPDSIAKEVKRIKDLNGLKDDAPAAGTELQIYSAADKAAFKKMASDRMAPIIGSEMVEMGIVKDDPPPGLTARQKLDKASKHELEQKGKNPGYRFGDAMVDLGFATRPEVEKAFKRQQEKRKEFGDVAADYEKNKK